VTIVIVGWVDRAIELFAAWVRRGDQLEKLTLLEVGQSWLKSRIGKKLDSIPALGILALCLLTLLALPISLSPSIPLRIFLQQIFHNFPTLLILSIFDNLLEFGIYIF